MPLTSYKVIVHNISYSENSDLSVYSPRNTSTSPILIFFPDDFIKPLPIFIHYMIENGFIVVVPSKNEEAAACLKYTIEHISKRFNGDPQNICVAGMGKGGDVAVGLKGARAMVVVSGRWKEKEVCDAPLLVIHGRNDLFTEERLVKEYCKKWDKTNVTSVMLELSGSSFASAGAPKAHYVSIGIERFLIYHAGVNVAEKKEN
jgi:hypothetical protein